MTELKLQAELLPNGKTWRLLEPLAYRDQQAGLIHVPAGFVTDFASTRPVRSIAVAALVLALLLSVLPWPWLSYAAFALGALALGLYAAVVGYGHPAAALHDWLYCTAALPRPIADAVYWRVLRATGHARWRAWLMWAGVRIGGARRYRSGSKALAAHGSGDVAG